MNKVAGGKTFCKRGNAPRSPGQLPLVSAFSFAQKVFEGGAGVPFYQKGTPAYFTYFAGTIRP